MDEMKRYHMLKDNDSLARALENNPSALKLRMQYVIRSREDRSLTGKPSSRSRSRSRTAPQVGSNPGLRSRSGSRSASRSRRNSRSRSSSHASRRDRPSRSFSSDVRASPSALIAMVSYLQKHGNVKVQSSINDLQEAVIQNSEDVAKLAEMRLELATLFSVFLNRVAETSTEVVPERLVEETLDRFESTCEKVEIHSASIETACEALRIISECPSAVEYMRGKWKDIASDGAEEPGQATAPNPPHEDKPEHRPKPEHRSKPASAPKSDRRRRLRQRRRRNAFWKSLEPGVELYFRKFIELIDAGGERVKRNFNRLHQYSSTHNSFMIARDNIDREFCRSIEQRLIHTATKHRRFESKYEIEHFRRISLEDTIRRKLALAGFDQHFNRHARKLLRSLLVDPEVVGLLLAMPMLIFDNVSHDDEEVLGMEEEFQSQPIIETDNLRGDEGTLFDTGRVSALSDADEDSIRFVPQDSRRERRRLESPERTRRHRKKRNDDEESGAAQRLTSGDEFGFDQAEVRWGSQPSDGHRFGSDRQPNSTSSLSTVDTSKSEWARVEMAANRSDSERRSGVRNGRRMHSPPRLRR